jgi:hypothetical protein
MTMLRREGRSLISRVEMVWTSLRKAAPRLLGIVLVPSTRTSLTSHSNDSFFDRQRGPKKADELSSNGDDDFVVLFASCGHAPIAPAQPTMRFVRYRDDVRGAVQLSASGAFGSPWRMPIVPSALDQDAACVTVARLGDPPALRTAAARVLTWNESQRGHQLARPTRASEVVKLGHQRHGGHRVDAVEAAKPLSVRHSPVPLSPAKATSKKKLPESMRGSEPHLPLRLRGLGRHPERARPLDSEDELPSGDRLRAAPPACGHPADPS